ncbi:MAG TPA: CsgG/HfaB family protein [Fibrobacteraceae bacterium]|nr:CsgG/HfaB family protein [Fibrobacteraceae bacterium]
MPRFAASFVFFLLLSLSLYAEELVPSVHVGMTLETSSLDTGCVAKKIAPATASLWAAKFQEAGFVQEMPAALHASLSVVKNGTLCDAMFSVRSLDSSLLFSVDLRREFSPKDTTAWGALPADISTELASRFFQATHGSLLVECATPGVLLQVPGFDESSCPARFEKMNPGRYAISASADGWNPRIDTIDIVPGKTVQRQIQLERNQAWLDSVAAAQKEARRDSIVQIARSTPTQALPEMFLRLFSVLLPAGTQTIAVVPFAVLGAAEKDYNPGVMAAEYAVTVLSKDVRFHVVERDHLDQLLAEQALAQAGAVSDSAAAQAGKLVSAQWIVTGTVTLLGSSQVFFARLVNVETGEIVSASAAQVGEESLRGLYLDAIGERTQVSSTIFRSLVAPGWGHFYANHPIRGSIWSTAVLGSIGYTIWRALDFRDKDEDVDQFADYDASTVKEGETLSEWYARANTAVDDRNDAAKQLNIAIGVLAGVWVANVLDAWWVGAQESDRIKTQYFSPKVALIPTTDGKSGGLLFAARF